MVGPPPPHHLANRFHRRPAEALRIGAVLRRQDLRGEQRLGLRVGYRLARIRHRPSDRDEVRGRPRRDQRRPRIDDALLLRAEPGEIIGRVRREVEADVGRAEGAVPAPLGHLLGGAAQAEVGLDRPARRLEGRRVQPTGPSDHEQGEARQQRHGAPRHGPPPRLGALEPGAGLSRQELLHVERQGWPGGDGEERHGPHPEGADEEHPRADEEPAPAPAGEVEQEGEAAE